MSFTFYAYYVLIICGHALPGETVLIYEEIGDIAMATMSIAVSMGCRVFVKTLNTTRQSILQQNFPVLPDNSIDACSDSSFERSIMIETKGYGVDLILNFTQHTLSTCYGCLGNNNRFLQITEEGLPSVNKSINFNKLLNSSRQVKKKLVELVNTGIKNGTVKPFKSIVFSKDKAEEAFRFNASVKVLLQLRPEEARTNLIPSPRTISAISRTYMDPEKSYILVGGLGDIGMELANWLILRGATKIVFSSRTCVKNGYQESRLKHWKKMQVTIVISTTNVTTDDGAMELIEDAKRLGPVRGIFNLSGVLCDALIENQTETSFVTVTQAKIETTKYLDEATRRLGLKLDYFVVFSSISCGRGNARQSNYGFANSAAEQICRARCSDGLPSIAIQWGLIGDVGISDNGIRESHTKEGIVAQSISSCLATLDIFMKVNLPVVSSFVQGKNRENKNNTKKTTITDVVGEVLGISDVNKVSKTATFSELGLDSLTGAEIQQTLSKDYNLILSGSEIRSLTLNRLSKLTTESSTPDTHQEMYDYPDKIMPCDIVLKMSNKHAQNNPIFFVHTIEGNVGALQILADLLEASVYGLQCCKDCPLNSINELAEYYIKHMKKIQCEGPYIIVGYSFGTIVAKEIGLQLETCGNVVKLILLDGSDSYVREILNHFKGTETYKQNLALTHFASNIKNIQLFINAEQLLAVNTFDERVALTAQLIANKTAYDLEDIKAALISFYFKIVAATLYQPNSVFTGEIMLLKLKNDSLSLEDDNGLRSVCNQEVKVHYVDGAHRSILEMPAVVQVASMINEFIKT